MNQVKYSIYIHQDNEVLDMGEFTNCEVPRVGEHINLSYLSSENLPITDLKYQVFKVEHIHLVGHGDYRIEVPNQIVVHCKCSMSHRTFHSFEELSKFAAKRFNLGNLFDQLD